MTPTPKKYENLDESIGPNKKNDQKWSGRRKSSEVFMENIKKYNEESSVQKMK